MEYNFDKPINRKNTDSIKWDKTKSFLGADNILPLWVADMDFEAPQEIFSALRKRINHNIYGYSFRPERYYKAMMDWFEKRQNWRIDRSWIMYSPGIITGLSMAINAFSSENDKIIIQTPVYPPFFEIIKENERQLLDNKLIYENNDYKIDFELLEKQMEEAEIFILCSPHNPLGKIWDKEDLLRIADLALENNVIIFSDEIHSDFTTSGKTHFPIASLSKKISDQTITFNSPSKTFNIAGLKMSSIITSNSDFKNKIWKEFFKHHLFMSNPLGVEAFTAAYQYGDDWLDQLLPYLEKNKKYVENFLKENIPAIKVTKTEGTFLLWLNFEDLGYSHEELNQILLKEVKIGLNDGLKFGENGKFFFRMNIGTTKKNIEEALKRLKIRFE